jgi:nicotinate-nucleotide pyrophosphorylase (carboxylating)
LADPPESRASTYPPQLDLDADASRLADLVLAEDGERDLTSELIRAQGRDVAAQIRCREDAVVAGTVYADAVAGRVGCGVDWNTGDGGRASAGEIVGTVRGDRGSVLRAERPLLNLLQRAFGIATATHRFVYAVAGTKCRILHTRKTAPGLRVFDAAAVVAGGGHLHRLGLERTVMIKDNHWEVLGASATCLAAVIAEARRRGTGAVQVEVERIDQVEAACRGGADRLLIDNQPPDSFRALAARARELAPRIELEATGGITVENAPNYAAAGADFLSVGSLTHSSRAIDLTLEL